MLDIVIDVTDLQGAVSNPLLFIWTFFRDGGWFLVIVIFAITLPIILYRNYIYSQQRKYLSKYHHVLLAIDIPKGNEQTPKAVEGVFAHLHGLQKNPAWIEKVGGFIAPDISLEIVGIEGQSQFLVQCREDGRDMIEAAIYAQYPDAAITEVRDYTEFIPKDYEAAGYDLWGTELILQNKDFYPIKTYPFFEHTMSQQFLDPLSSLLEMFSKLGPTEQVWLQLVISPINDHWTKAANHEVKKIIGEKEKHAKHPAVEIAGNVTSGLYEAVTATVISPGKKEEKKLDSRQPSYTYLPPGEQAKVQGIEMKIAKLGYEVKFRMIYWAKKEFMNKTTGVLGVIGAIKQWNTQDQNAFKPEPTTKTTINYFFKKYRLRKRKERLIYNYRHRILHRQFQHRNPFTRAWHKPIILNTEELASIFHFPVEPNVKAPMLQKTEAKRAGAPISLPVEPAREQSPKLPGHTDSNIHAGAGTEHGEQRAEPPANLPIG